MNSSLGRLVDVLKPRRVLLVIVALVIAWSGVMSGRAEATTDYASLLGGDAYETSVLISKAGFAPGVKGVVVASAQDYMAATSSAVLAAAYGGPVLLTALDSLDDRVAAELKRLQPGRIFVVGVAAGVGAAITRMFPELADDGRIVTLRGSDGSETACLVAEQVMAAGERPGGVVLVSQDALAAPPACAVAASALAAGRQWPLLFVPTSGQVADSVARTLAKLSPAVVIAVQSNVDVGPEAMVVRLGGSNVYEIGAKVARYASSVGLDYEHLVVIQGSEGSSGQGFSAGAYLARNKGIVVISAADWVPTETIALLLGKGAAIKRMDFCGPQAAISARLKSVSMTQGPLPEGFGVLTLKRGDQASAVRWLEQRLTDLSYRPGKIDGKFDGRTRQALIAFEKWEGMKRDGIAGPEVWWSLLEASLPVPKIPHVGTWVEVDIEKQVLLFCVDGRVERTIPVSTGGDPHGIVTPLGVFRVVRENTYERYRYKPLYIVEKGHLAIHGYSSVPVFPDSHGCVRVTWADMDELHAKVPVGTAVYIY